MNKICITGASGFIGSHIVEYFHLMGEDIHCVSRVEADLRDVDKLIAAFQGADCVIHNAAMACDWGSYGTFHENNVNGTINVMKACLANHISQVIITGSCSVYGEEDNQVIKDENSPLNSNYPYFLNKLFPCAMNYYRDTKKQAKVDAMHFAKSSGMNLTIINPVWVFGEREFHTGFYDYLKTAKMGIPFIMGSKKNKFHVIYAKDLAKAYHLAYKANIPGINTFIIGNRKAEYMDKIFAIFCEEAGFRKPKNINKVLIYPIGFLLELLYTCLKIKKPPLLTRGRVNMFYDNIEYSTQKATDMFGFKCEYKLREAISNTVKWYKSEGYL